MAHPHAQGDAYRRQSEIAHRAGHRHVQGNHGQPPWNALGRASRIRAQARLRRRAGAVLRYRASEGAEPDTDTEDVKRSIEVKFEARSTNSETNLKYEAQMT